MEDNVTSNRSHDNKSPYCTNLFVLLFLWIVYLLAIFLSHVRVVEHMHINGQSYVMVAQSTKKESSFFKQIFKKQNKQTVREWEREQTSLITLYVYNNTERSQNNNNTQIIIRIIIMILGYRRGDKDWISDIDHTCQNSNHFVTHKWKWQRLCVAVLVIMIMIMLLAIHDM